MIKRGRSKGTEVQIISLPSQKMTSLEIKKDFPIVFELKQASVLKGLRDIAIKQHG